MIDNKSDFKSLDEVILNCNSYYWTEVGVTSKQFYPVFCVNGINMKTIYYTGDVKGHSLFTTMDYSGVYSYYDYNLNTKEVARYFGVDSTKFLFYKVKEFL